MIAKAVAVIEWVKSVKELFKASLGYCRAYGYVKSEPWLKEMRKAYHKMIKAKNKVMKNNV
jgi:hypothetical protein